jgi:hypothetical protein
MLWNIKQHQMNELVECIKECDKNCKKNPFTKEYFEHKKQLRAFALKKYQVTNGLSDKHPTIIAIAAWNKQKEEETRSNYYYRYY